MPWERVVEYCKSHENVWTIVDAAHAIGQIVEIKLNKTQPDFFVSVGSILVMELLGLSCRTSIELPQMAVCKARMCSSLHPTKVTPQTSACHRGNLPYDRNQHLIKTTLPTSAGYVSPKDYAKDPTLPKPPNFVEQFKCRCPCCRSHPHCLTIQTDRKSVV